jgi:hypothetical protein
MSIVTIPVRSMMVDKSLHITEVWVRFFQDQFGYGKVTESSGNIADIPTNLKKADAGYLYTATDYARSYRWTGTAWERAEGNSDPHRYIWCDTAPGAGWVKADGSGIQRTRTDGTLEGYVVKNLIGYYLKGANVAAAGVTATAPGLTGSTSAEPDHDHAIDHDHGGAIATSGPTATVNVQNGTGFSQTVATGAHVHTVTVPGVSQQSGLAGGHSHTAGTLAVDATAEPAHVALIPYYRQ